MQFLDLATEAIRILAPISPGYAGFTVSSDQKTILYTESNPLASDVMVADNFADRPDANR